MNRKIAVIRGDGIGPEIVAQAVGVLNKVAELYGHSFSYADVDMGGCAIDRFGDPLPREMLEKCLASDSVLLGAVGGPKWNDSSGESAPGKGTSAPARRDGRLQQQPPRENLAAAGLGLAAEAPDRGKGH